MRSRNPGGAIVAACAAAVAVVSARAPAIVDDAATRTVIVSGCVAERDGAFALANVEPVAGEQEGTKGTTTDPTSRTNPTDPSGAASSSTSASLQAAPGVATAAGGSAASGSAAIPEATAAASGSTSAAAPAGASVSSGGAAMSPMTPTSNPDTAVRGAVYTIAGVGPVARTTTSPPRLVSSYHVSSDTDLKTYRGKRVQVVGVIVSPPAGATPTAASEMKLESIRVVDGRCGGK